MYKRSCLLMLLFFSFPLTVAAVPYNAEYSGYPLDRHIASYHLGEFSGDVLLSDWVAISDQYAQESSHSGINFDSGYTLQFSRPDFLPEAATADIELNKDFLLFSHGFGELGKTFSDIKLNSANVPEPSSLLLFIGGFALFLSRRLKTH